MPTLHSRLSCLRCKFPVSPLRRLMDVLRTVVSMIPTSRNLKKCCRLHSAPARPPQATWMKRWEGFKLPVSTPRARLATEIIILFEMKTVIVIDKIFIGVYGYTGNRYIPTTHLSITQPVGRAGVDGEGARAEHWGTHSVTEPPPTETSLPAVWH